jgi:hypothetical protein
VERLAVEAVALNVNCKLLQHVLYIEGWASLRTGMDVVKKREPPCRPASQNKSNKCELLW